MTRGTTSPTELLKQMVALQSSRMGATFHSHLGKQGTRPSEDSILRLIITDPSSNLIGLCNSLQLHRLVDLIDYASGNPQWLTPNPDIDCLLPRIPEHILILLTTNQYWKFPMPTSTDIFQILYWTTETVHVRR